MQCSIDQVEYYADEYSTMKLGIKKENIKIETIVNNRLAETNVSMT